MRVLVTGSSGHLGETLMRLLDKTEHEAVGVDLVASRWTTHVGSIADPAVVADCMNGIDAVMHTATLHKPHVATHTKQDFIDVNVTGTLNLLEQAVASGVSRFIFTSTTSVFSRRCNPGPDEPSVWVTEELTPLPKNIYGVTKLSAEGLCELFHFRTGLPCLVLRTSRFFPEEDDRASVREEYSADNAKLNELLYRRVDIGDAARAHLRAMERAPDIGFGRYIISATTPFSPCDVQALRDDARVVLENCVPFQAEYASRGWEMPRDIARVYVNTRAREELGWRPRVDFSEGLSRVQAGERLFGSLTYEVGSKGYHSRVFEGGP
ncbi:MAG: UDP-glucose 4-epimerase [Bradymonadia bacterium]|jgi:UDP-glucose 4-epimerase